MSAVLEKITILGCGTSTGVPVIGCACDVCSSAEPRNKRTRSSIMLTTGAGQTIVIDTGPEFRFQMLRERVNHLEHVLYTHIHADHCNGFDDLRVFSFNLTTTVACHMPSNHLAEFRARFAYAFEDTGYVGAKPQVDLVPIEEDPFMLAGLWIEPARVPHGHVLTTVYKIGRFLYATDFKAFPEALIERWRGHVDVMVASGVHFREHVTHSNVPQTVALMAKLGVKRGIVTHLAHDVDYVRDASRLPAGVEFAYDGLTIDMDGAPLPA